MCSSLGDDETVALEPLTANRLNSRRKKRRKKRTPGAKEEDRRWRKEDMEED